jgi:hypothetical protein
VGKFKRNSGRRKQGCKEKEEPRREGWNLKKETQIQNQYQYQGEEHRGTEGSEKRLGFEGGARNNKVLEYPRYHHFFLCARETQTMFGGQGRTVVRAAVKDETGTGVYFWQPAKFSPTQHPAAHLT